MAANAGRVILKGKMKVKGVPSASSQLGKYLGIPEPPRADTSKLISTFIKINNRQVFRPQSSTRTSFHPFFFLKNNQFNS